MCWNRDDVVTPIKVDCFEKLLKQYQYDKQKTQFLVNGFKYGFDIGYRGPLYRKNLSEIFHCM